MKKKLEIPDVVEQKIQDAYREIGQGNVTMKKLNNGNQKKKRAWTAAAAARRRAAVRIWSTVDVDRDTVENSLMVE